MAASDSSPWQANNERAPFPRVTCSRDLTAQGVTANSIQICEGNLGISRPRMQAMTGMPKPIDMHQFYEPKISVESTVLCDDQLANNNQIKWLP